MTTPVAHKPTYIWIETPTGTQYSAICPGCGWRNVAITQDMIQAGMRKHIKENTP